jgi:hypothetical protein
MKQMYLLIACLLCIPEAWGISTAHGCGRIFMTPSQINYSTNTALDDNTFSETYTHIFQPLRMSGGVGSDSTSWCIPDYVSISIVHTSSGTGTCSIIPVGSFTPIVGYSTNNGTSFTEVTLTNQIDLNALAFGTVVKIYGYYNEASNAAGSFQTSSYQVQCHP